MKDRYKWDLTEIFENESVLEEDLKQLTLYDNEYCEKANYRVISVLPQNKKMKIVFKKILDSEVL